MNSEANFINGWSLAIADSRIFVELLVSFSEGAICEDIRMLLKGESTMLNVVMMEELSMQGEVKRVLKARRMIEG